MNSTLKRIVAMLLALCMMGAMLAACDNSGEEDDTTASDTTGSSGGNTTEEDTGTYTYNTYTGALSTSWSPFTWEDSGQSAVLDYMVTYLVDCTVLDSEASSYQWVYKAATAVDDVTSEYNSLLYTYGVVDSEESASEITEGYIYKFTLNENLTWADGTQIDADTYIYSMQQLLDSSAKNYRANTYYTGSDGALAGAYNYYYAGDSMIRENYLGTVTYEFADLVLGDDGIYYTPDGEMVYILADVGISGYLGGYTISDYGAYFDADALAALLAADTDGDGYLELTDESYALLVALLEAEGSAAWNESEADAPVYFGYTYTFPEADFDNVGLVKISDYEFLYVLENELDLYNFFYNVAWGNWLVYEPYYEATKVESTDSDGNTVITSSYCTSIDTTMSYGPYMFSSIEEDKQMVWVQNPAWYGYTTDDDGNVIASTSENLGYQVDGEYVRIYQTQTIVWDVMESDTAKLAFLSGELDDWTPTSDDLVDYYTSERLITTDQTYTMRLFFNSNLETLQSLDANGDNKNSVVLSNSKFREAFSLAIDRSEWVTTTGGYSPAYYLINSLYYYDVFEDPESIYRNTDYAMQAICDLYGVSYGDGEVYSTLKEAYESITGYNLTEAQSLMAEACAELVAAGLYTEGEEIYIQVAWSYNEMTTARVAQVQMLEDFLNTAAEGSGFGTITLEGIGNLSGDLTPYTAVPAGYYAIGYGAWGGAAFSPFTLMRLYMDPDYTTNQESGCWDPTSETLTLTVNGEEVTMTWQAWSQSIVAGGAYGAESNELKCEILAMLEEAFLSQYYCIPLACSADNSMLGWQVEYYTYNYTLMYGYGGLELMTYNYNDEEWTAAVEAAGGTVTY